MKLSGDLCNTAEHFPFVVEVKRREAWSLDRLLKGKKSPVQGWWKQCCKSAEEMGGKPLLIFRKNKEPWLVMGRVADLQFDAIFLHDDRDVGGWFGLPGGELVVFELSHLLKWHPTDYVAPG